MFCQWVEKQHRVEILNKGEAFLQLIIFPPVNIDQLLFSIFNCSFTFHYFLSFGRRLFDFEK